MKDKANGCLSLHKNWQIAGLPLCWKTFSENTTPHEQHWVYSVHMLPGNHISAIGQQHMNTANVNASFRSEVQWYDKGRGKIAVDNV